MHNNTKRLGRPQRTVDDHRIISLVMNKTFIHQGGGFQWQRFTIKRCPHGSESSRVDFTIKHLKEGFLVWTDETEINLQQNDGRRKCGETYHITVEAVLWDVFTDDVTADRSNGMNSDVCGAKLSAWIPTNVSKLADFTVQMDKDYNHTAKQPKSFSRQRNGVFFILMFSVH